MERLKDNDVWVLIAREVHSNLLEITQIRPSLNA